MARTTSRHRRSKERIVTVCLANRARSPTTEWLLHRDYRVKSCGTAEFDATKPCDQYDMKWATRVLVMEAYQKRNLEQRFPEETAGKVENLDVPEVGKYSCQPSLLEEIAKRLEEHGYRHRNIRNLGEASNNCIQWTSNMADRKLRAQIASDKVRILDLFGERIPVPVRETTAITEARALEPWQIEEQEAFERARRVPSGQGGITWFTTEKEKPETLSTTEDKEGMRVWLGDQELTDAEIDSLVMGQQAPKKKGQTKLMEELKKYADSVKEFFK